MAAEFSYNLISLNREESHMNIPTTLPNGAELIDIFYNVTSKQGVVRASSHKGEWVTWRFHSGDLKTTYCGHYWTDEGESIADFDERVDSATRYY